MVFGSFARKIASANKKSLLLGVGAATALSGYALYQAPAENSCKGAVREAYRRFMPMNDYPELSGHNNCLSKVLTPQLYAKLRDLVRLSTSVGKSLQRSPNFIKFQRNYSRLGLWYFLLWYFICYIICCILYLWTVWLQVWAITMTIYNYELYNYITMNCTTI